MKILIVDTLYQQFLDSWQHNPAGSYDSELRQLLNFSFGTFDAYSRNLSSLGWETEDCIANWQFSRPPSSDCDVVFMQDLSIEPPVKGQLLAGQLSCPWPGDDRVKRHDVLFSSFPHYIDRIEALGVKAVYNPLAFDPIVLERVGVQSPFRLDKLDNGNPELSERPYDCVFVGGVGAPSHWRKGMEVLEAVAREIPTFKWWGYGFSEVSRFSPLRDKYQGEAWGLDMYKILLQSKIVLNRHGEVAEGYTNNMRCFEATGCGAMLMTERSKNLHDFFSSTEAVAYSGPEEAVWAIKGLLNNEPLRKQIAAGGQARTLRDHTYAQRMKTVSDTLTEMLVAHVESI